MNLKRHLRTIHLKIKAFACEHCPDKKYTSKVTLDQHMITKHGQETDYCCRCCGRKFPTMSFLRSHMKSTCSGSPAAVRERGDPNEYREHLGEEHYRCKICSVIVEGKGKIAQVESLSIYSYKNCFLYQNVLALRTTSQTQQRLRAVPCDLQQLLKPEEAHSDSAQQNSQIRVQLLREAVWSEESIAKSRVSSS